MSYDKPKIVEAALGLLDEEGLEGVSTRRLAARLGISGPSIYWHFRSKQELLDHMAEALLRTALPAPNLDGPDFDWEAWLVKGARGMRRAALSHRDGALLLMASQPTDSHYADGLALMVRTLRRTGLAEAEARRTLMGLGRFAIGWAAQEMRTGRGRDNEGFEFGLQMFIAGLRQLIAGKARARVPLSRADRQKPRR